ncbi:MAG TPA: hypothetical protein VJG90_00045 [Candidatus Nanoarchaeia archaeon]|nr:hypothetical protein [Candidatus Nanoarchaeia archaeon]
MTRFSPELQLDNLGIDLIRVKKAKILDVGCGRNADLVNFLRNQGIEAEGIDGLVHNEDHLIQGWVLDLKSIPRPSKNYGVVVTHMNPSLYDPRTDKNEKNAENFSWRAARIILEMLRVVQQSGELRCFPSLKFLDEKIKRLDLPIEHEPSYFKGRWILGHVPVDVKPAYQDMFDYRTIIRKD